MTVTPIAVRSSGRTRAHPAARSSIAADLARHRERAAAAPPALRVVRAEAKTARGDARRDVTILELIIAGLAAFGLVMVLSASSVVSIVDYGSPWSLFLRQAIWTVLGAAAFVLARRVELAKLRRCILPFLVGTLVLLVAVMVPHLGQASGGSSRWIGAGPIKIQPSEFAKLALALFAADLLARRHAARDFNREVLRPLLLVLAIAALLVVRQPDLGTAIILVGIAAAALYAGGIQRRVLAWLVGAALFLGGILAVVAPYRRDRLLSFLQPFSHASTTSYQLAQSLAALGSGHIVGAGLGSSVAQWYLPNAQTDFIFAVVGNELGLVGTIAVVACFVGIGVLGLRIAARATDRFGAILATALTCWIVLQAFFNIGGVIGVMPETGIPLPFLSFGGSALVVALAAMGLLVNIAEPRATMPSRRRSAAKGRGRVATTTRPPR